MRPTIRYGGPHAFPRYIAILWPYVSDRLCQIKNRKPIFKKNADEPDIQNVVVKLLISQTSK